MPYSKGREGAGGSLVYTAGGHTFLVLESAECVLALTCSNKPKATALTLPDGRPLTVRRDSIEAVHDLKED
jgi:hypothetical protein